MITISLCSGLFLRLLLKRNKVEIQVFGDRLLPKIAASFGCVALFYVLLDKSLDPILEAAFPQSEEQYQEMLRSLNQAPLASLIQVCILALFCCVITHMGYNLISLSYPQ